MTVFGQRSQLWWDLPLRDSFDLLRHVCQGTAGDLIARLAVLPTLRDIAILEPDIEDVVTRLYRRSP